MGHGSFACAAAEAIRLPRGWADTRAIRASGAAYVLLHWNPVRAFYGLETNAALGEARGRFVATLRDRLLAELGRPLLEDGVLTMFAVR